MRKNDIFDAFESLDPKVVEEAAPNINKKAIQAIYVIILLKFTFTTCPLLIILLYK